MVALGKMADLMIVNVVALICCIPIITIGPSLTALHYVALKIVRDEECYIVRGFFKSFKENFKQGVLLWLIFLVVGIVIVGDIYIMQNSGIEFHFVLRIMVLVVAVLTTFTFTFAFPILAKFDNTIRRTLKNAFLISLMQFPKTILMILSAVAPILLILISESLIPITILFCLSFPAYASALLYNKFFQKLEDQILAATEGETGEVEESGEDDRIFRDELDESLIESDVTVH